MQAFIRHTGIAVPLLRANVNTDAIIPSREMKRVSKKGLGRGLFANWRYRPGGYLEDADFILNQPAYRQASILLSGANFGCGSSREHAVWALTDFGFRALIAPSFGTIFYNNCIYNGLLPVRLPDADVRRIATQVSDADGECRLTVDLECTRVTMPDGDYCEFSIEPGNRETLLQGLDPISATLLRESRILAYEQRRRRQFAWLFDDQPRRTRDVEDKTQARA